MKYLCLIHIDEQKLAAIPPAEASALNAAHLDFNDNLRAAGRFHVAEALDPAQAAATVRVRDGKTSITDGPFAEAKEVVAGFYLIEADTLAEATQIASQIPSVRIGLGAVEVRPARQLVVEGRPLRWG